MKRSLLVLAILSVAIAGLRAPAAMAVFGVGDQTFNTTVQDIPRSISEATQRAVTAAKNRIKDATAIAFKNSIRTFLATTVQQFALSLATTQPGQKPLFLTQPKTFFRDVADAAAGNFIDDFTRGITGGRWDPRCDSKEPAIRAKCTGITGGTTGPGGSLSQQGRFIVSRLLRAGSDATLEGCLNDCKERSQVTTRKPTEIPGLITSLSQLDKQMPKGTTFHNDFERRVSVLEGWLEYGGINTKFKSDPGMSVTCPDVVPNPTTSDVGLWIFDETMSACRGSAAAAFCSTTAADCVQRIENAINYEISKASADATTCRKACQEGFGADVRSFVNRATASDVISYVQNIDIRQTPKLIATRFNNNSDISQYFSAVGLVTSAVQAGVTGEQTYLNTRLLPRTSKVNEAVLSPPEAASALFGIPFYNNEGELTYTGTGIADILKGIASFINSPVGKALFTYFRSKCGVNPNACSGPQNPQSVVGQILFGGGGPTGIAAAQAQYAGIAKIDYINGDPGNSEIDVLGQLSSNGLIDPQMRLATEEGLTIRQAIDRNLLSRDKIVGYDKNGIEAKNGYPYRALQYLRKYRIIPVGWELAAKYAYSFTTRDLTLGRLVDDYNICAQDDKHKVCSESLNSCTDNSNCQSGETCGASPFCGLVDPDWVLKAPQSFCRRQGAGEEIVSKEFVCDVNNVDATTGDPTADTTVPPNCIQSDTNEHPDIGRWIVTRNTDICADEQSCLAEDDSGKCIAYGYCMQERQTFKFDGTQCQAQNASCVSYTSRTGEDVAYLSKNLDLSCSPEAAGCQWYCTQPSYNAEKKSWTCTDSTGSKTFFTAQAGTCSANDKGCSQFIRLRPGTNYIPNGGFEYYEGGALDRDPARFIGWTSGPISMTPVTPSDNENPGGSAAVRVVAPAATSTISQTVDIGSRLNDRSFTFTLRTQSASACTGSLTLCTGNDCASSSVKKTTSFEAGENWQTASVGFVVPSVDDAPLGSTRMTVIITPSGCRASGLVIDSAQLAEANEITSFADYGTENVTYLNEKRRACSPADVGCEKYTPLSGGAVINGIIGDSNRCDASQVGCQLYRREPITHLPYRDYTPEGGPRPVDVTIVAANGKQCSAAEVGCEEYTNLDEVKRGGEGKAYFKEIKQCVQPTNTSIQKQTYYTWTTDPTRGFVLRSQQLAISNLPGGAPCTNLSHPTTEGASPTCEDTAATVSAATSGCQAVADLADNPDCGEFYDSDLNVYYRLRSKTVTVSTECSPYRNTIDEKVYFLSARENVSCQAAAAGCREFIGNTGGASRQVFKDTFERSTLANWIGGTWSNIAANASGHSIKIDLTAGSDGVAYSTVEALRDKIRAGKSYLVSVTAAPATDTADTRLQVFLGTEGATVGTFETRDGVPFQSDAGIPLKWNELITPKGPEWHTYKLGPVTIGDAVNPNWRLGLVVRNGSVYVDSLTLTEISNRAYLVDGTAPSCPAAAIGCAAYRNRAGTIEYATSFARLCSDKVVGCEVMIDTKNSATPFTQTVKDVTTPADEIVTLVYDTASQCKASAKGCSMYGLPLYGRDNTLTGFKTTYIKNDPDRHTTDLCLESEDSCESYTTSNGSAAYFRDPRSSTCEYRTGSTEMSGWYITGTSYKCPTVSSSAIGQPVGKSCSPVCAGGTRSGKPCANVGTALECPGSLCAGDASTVGMIKNDAGKSVFGSCVGSDRCIGGNKCVYLVGICPQEENGCTEYRDPSDPPSCRSECPLQQLGGTPISVDVNCARTVCNAASGTRSGQNCRTSEDCGSGGACVGLDGVTPTTGAPGCRGYYYLRQSVEDTSSECNGQINGAVGCRPFNDTTNPTLEFRGI